MDSVLGIFTHIETIVAFLLLIIPGFMSLRAYETRRRGEPRKVNETLVDVVIYSFATDIVSLPIVWQIRVLSDGLLRTALLVASAAGFIATAIFIGRGWYSLRVKLAKIGAVVDRIAKQWDKFFGGVAKEKQVGIILTLPDGRKIGGRFVPGFA